VKKVPAPCGPYVDLLLIIVGEIGGGTEVGGMMRVFWKSSNS
jgi:hypothetical protein